MPGGAEGGAGSGGASGGVNSAGLAGSAGFAGASAGEGGSAQGGSAQGGSAQGGRAQGGRAQGGREQGGRAQGGREQGGRDAGGAGGSGGQGGSTDCATPTRLTLAATTDAYLSEAKSEQKTNFGDATPLLVSGVVSARARLLVNFDLSTVPSGAKITRARLRLVFTKAVAGERTFSVYRVGREWQEDKATWVRAATMPATDWTLPGGDIALVVSDTQTVVDPASGTTVDFEVASDVEALVAAGSPGYGWLVDTATGQDMVELSSRESLFVEERPKLALELCP